MPVDKTLKRERERESVCVCVCVCVCERERERGEGERERECVRACMRGRLAGVSMAIHTCQYCVYNAMVNTHTHTHTHTETQNMRHVRPASHFRSDERTESHVSDSVRLERKNIISTVDSVQLPQPGLISPVKMGETLPTAAASIRSNCQLSTPRYFSLFLLTTTFSHLPPPLPPPPTSHPHRAALC